MSKIKHIFSVIHYTIYGAGCFQFSHFPCDDWENIQFAYYHHQSEVWTIIHCLVLGHETMVCAVCLSIFFWNLSVNWNLSYSPETPNLDQNRRFFSHVTLQFDVWPWKTIGHLFYANSSFVHHFVAIGEFKLELQSGNAQFGSNSTIFRAVWPRNWRITLKQGKSEGFDSCDRPIKLELQSGNSQFGSNSTIFGAMWRSKLTYDLEKQ